MFGKPVTPATVPTDTVIPFRFFDDTPLWTAFILYSMFVFDDVLDCGKLRGSLESLAMRDGWSRLGARLRKNVSDKKISGTEQTNTACRLKDILNIMSRLSSQSSAELSHTPIQPMI